MSFQTNWEISGTDINTAKTAFIKSAQVSVNNLKKHENELNKFFKDNIYNNMIRVGVDADNFSDVFELKIDSNKVSFINTAPLITQRYEYGYYNGSNDTNEEYYEEYMIQTSPRYFIRPAIQDTLNSVGRTLLADAQREYQNNH